MDIVLIPAYNRPEFLQVCLERIEKANGSKDKYYVFALEYGHHPDCRKMADDFISRYNGAVSPCKERRSKGNQYNVLEGYVDAYYFADIYKSNLIYQIEPDIWISKGFFDMHEYIHSKENIFSVSGCRNQDNKSQIKLSEKGHYYLFDSFQSLGVSFKPFIVEEIVRHANNDYYSNPVKYLDSMFPNSSRKGRHYEQAGLINRIREASGMKSAFPYDPMAYHAGFYGVNRAARKLTGTTEEKAKALKLMSADDMNNRAKKYKDITPCDLNAEWLY